MSLQQQTAIQAAIANAATIEEVSRLEKALATGQMPSEIQVSCCGKMIECTVAHIHLPALGHLNASKEKPVLRMLLEDGPEGASRGMGIYVMHWGVIHLPSLPISAAFGHIT